MVNTLLNWRNYGILTFTKLLTRVLLRSLTLRLRREPFREPQPSAASNTDPSIVDDDRFADPLLPVGGMAVIIWCNADSEIEKWARGSLPVCGVPLPSCEIPETLHGRSPVTCRRLFLNTTWENEQKITGYTTVTFTCNEWYTDKILLMCDQHKSKPLTVSISYLPTTVFRREWQASFCHRSGVRIRYCLSWTTKATHKKFQLPTSSHTAIELLRGLWFLLLLRVTCCVLTTCITAVCRL